MKISHAWLQFKKRETLSRITHVIDCEAYSSGKDVFLREVSKYRVKTGECMRIISDLYANFIV